MAWRLPERPGHDTGHVFVVADTPVVQAEGIVYVDVHDANDVPHYNDVRGGSPPSKTGVGLGTIHLRVDGDGLPISFQFNESAPFKAVPIAIGRIKPFSADGDQTSF